MLRALVAFVVLLLATGVFALVTGGTSGPSAEPVTSPTSFGFALAAGSIALAVTLLASRPRLRFRR